MTKFGALVLLGTSACAVAPHPVQPSPNGWRLPAAYAHCRAEEQVAWPNGQVTVTVNCPDALLLFDKTTKAVVERVTWAEIYGRKGGPFRM